MNRRIAAVALGVVAAVVAYAALGPGARPMPGSAPPSAEATDAPEFAGITSWLNTTPLKLADLRGRVVVVHFWTNGCINCIHNYPSYRNWQAKYADRSVTIVGVHTPEFEAEKDLDRLRKRAADNRLTFPIAVDSDGKTWAAWGNRFWPAVYLVDKKGKVRYRWEGELNFKETRGEEEVARRIDALLAE
jgi:peroxiredoxin